jgi:hypothetical protein
MEHPWMKMLDKEQGSAELFTEQEKTYIRHEFTYNETTRLNRNEQHNSTHQKLNLFPEHLLDST